MADNATVEEVKGVVSFLACQKPTFCAGKMTSEGRGVSFSVKGYCKVGDTITVRGSWEKHPQYGMQFKGKDLTLSLPTDADGLKKWLNWNVPKVGPITATKLVDEFGIDLMERCGSDAESVAIFGKLPIETVELMARKWTEEGHRVGALTWLAGHGLTQKQCEAVMAKFGGGSIQLVQDDPFHLIGRVEGFGWTTTDALAKRLDITGDDPRRLRGAVVAVVRETYDEGSTCVLQSVACQKAADKLGVRDPNLIADMIEDAVTKGDVTRFGPAARPYLATQWAIRCERFAWNVFLRSREPNPHTKMNDEEAERAAECYRTLGPITFDDSQIAAIKNALRYRISVVTGGAGSGKTQISKAIVKAFQDDDVPVFLAAPTGKAARRMKEVIGHHASTIHRLLDFNGGTGQFGRDEAHTIDNCLVLIDEASMCDAEIIYRLLAAMGPNCSLVFVGDPNQLPPVGPGSMLRDVLCHDLVPATRLEHCHRQAGYLKENCVAILGGKVPGTVTDYPEGGFSPWMVSANLTAENVAEKIKIIYGQCLPKWKFDPVTQAQFMTAKHAGAFGTQRLNLLLQHLHQTATGNPIPEPASDSHNDDDWKKKFYFGDKVIQTKNNYDLGVMNGEVGFVVAIDVCRKDLVKMLTPKPDPIDSEPGTDDDGTFDLFGADGEPNEEVIRAEDTGAAKALAKSDAGAKPVADYVVQFPDRRVVFPVGTGSDLQLAYCLSVHKMQGSQVDCAIVIVPRAHQFMQNRSWAYTGATRAQKCCIILGDPDGIHRAAEKIVVDDRETILRVFATCEEARP